MFLHETIQTDHLSGYINQSGLYTNDGELMDSSISCPTSMDYPVVFHEDGQIEVIQYVELVGKTDYTIRGSIAKVKDIVTKSDVGIGITDTGVGYGLYALNQEALSQHKKPILGAELSTGDCHYYFIAKNRQGYQELIRLLTEYSAGQSNLDSSLIPKTDNLILLMDSYTPVDESVMAPIHEEDIYFTRHIEYSNDDEMYDLSDKYDKPLVLITNYHRVNKEDDKALEAFRMIGEYTDRSVLGADWYVHTSQEMVSRGVPTEWMESTIEIYNKIESFNLRSDQVYYPEFVTPEEFESDRAYWDYLIDRGLKHRLGGHIPEEYQERLVYEKDMIASMGYISYFLIVADFINYAKRSFETYDKKTVERWKQFIEDNHYDPAPIAIGPARGSVAGSLVAYAMNIIDIDPLKYDLLFERFLNPDRISLPDIDTDIPDNKRSEIIHYTKDYYNTSSELVESRVAGIGTFGTFKIKQLLRALVSALYDKDTRYANLLSDLAVDPEMSFEEYVQLDAVQQEVGEDLRFQRIAEVAPKLMNCIANLTQHAAGYVITPGAVTDFFPTVFVRDNQGHITEQLTAYTDVESLGILKMDYLGLRSMTVIDSAIKEINDFYGTEHTASSILKEAPTDIDVFRHIEAGNTYDVFQLASSGMTSVITRSLSDIHEAGAVEKAESGDYFSRIIAGIAMYRPGPMQFIDEFIRNALFPDKIEYPIEEMRDVLESSYGLMIYQESIMALLQRVAGFSLAQADIARRAISKKDYEDLRAQKEVFIHGNGDDVPGGLALGHDLDELEELWLSVETFAAYGFNKSHAAGYAHIAITTAWLAYHYPAHFAIANLNNPDNSDSIKELISVYKQRGLTMLPASVNESSGDFTTDGESIRFGLSGVKMLASKANAIFQEREERGEFTDLYNFLSRMARHQADTSLNKLSIEGLIYAGALDEFKGSRQAKLDAIGEITGLFSLLKKEEQVLFDTTNSDYFDHYLQLHDMEMDSRELLDKEYEYTGFYISGHPTDNYQSTGRSFKGFKPIADLELYDPSVVTLGVITRITRITTKTDGRLMAFITIEDRNSSIEAVVFPNTYADYGRYVKDGLVVLLHGNMDEDGQLLVSSIQDAGEVSLQFGTESVHINLPEDLDEATTLLEKVIYNKTANQLQSVPLYYYVDGKKYHRANIYRDEDGKLQDIRVYLNHDIINEIYRTIGQDNFWIVRKTNEVG